MPFFSSVAASVRKRFYDNFSRSNTTGGLGIATDGSLWNPINGTIQVTSGAATATTTPTVVSTTRSSGGASGTTTFVVASATGIVIGQTVSGYGIQNGTTVSNLVGTTVTLSLATTAQLTGTYLFLSNVASQYPMATVDMPTTNNSIEITSVHQGSSAAIWVQSSSDWWMVDVESTFNTIPGNSNYSYSQNATTGGNTNPYNVTTNYNIVVNTGATNYGSGPSYFSYINFTSYAAYNSYTSYAYGYSPSSTYGGGGTNAYVAGNYYTYASGTNAVTYSYSQYLNIKKSVSSVVSTVQSWLVSTTQTIASIRVKTQGNVITSQVFSDASLITQIGSDLIYTATGAAINTTFGIAISPSAYQQSAIIGTSSKITIV